MNQGLIISTIDLTKCPICGSEVIRDKLDCIPRGEKLVCKCTKCFFIRVLGKMKGAKK